MTNMTNKTNKTNKTSPRRIYQSVHPKENHDILFQVGGEQPEKINPVLLEYVGAYIHYIKLFHRLLYIIAESKAEFDTNYDSGTGIEAVNMTNEISPRHSRT